MKSILNDGNKYWVDLAWKESDKMKTIQTKSYHPKVIWTLIGRNLKMNNEQIEAFVEVLVPIIEECINKGK